MSFLMLSSVQAGSGPVKSVAAAKAAAQSWLTATTLVGLSVGPVKDLALVYFVDLVETDGTGAHSNHLVVRKADGFASLVYPAHDAPKLPREQRLGLDGLAGMSGMSGMTGSAQRRSGTHGSVAVLSDNDARRGVESWLWMNGMQDDFLLQEVEPMNNVYVVDLYSKTKQRRLVNQAILRGVDGYVTLVRPLPAKVMHFPTSMVPAAAQRASAPVAAPVSAPVTR